MQDNSGNEWPPSLLSTDLILVGLLGIFMIAVGTEYVESLPGQSLFGLLGVLFAPGYAIVSALFPRDSGGPIFEEVRADVTTTNGNITVAERILLAVGLSVCAVPLIGLGLSFTSQGIEPSTLLGLTGAVTVMSTAIATVRRRAQGREQFDPRIARFLGDTIRKFGTSWNKSMIAVFVVFGLAVAAGGIGVAALDADRGEQFTELYILTSDPGAADQVADSYPDEIAVGDSAQVTVGITNNEGKTVEYDIVVQLQSIGPDGGIRQAQTVATFTPTVEPGGTWEQPHSISPELTGENLRVTYLLYTDSSLGKTVYQPANAYRSTHFWVDVPRDG